LEDLDVLLELFAVAAPSTVKTKENFWPPIVIS
jgi:hypothetical protein